MARRHRSRTPAPRARVLALVLVTGLVAVLVAGCGDDGPALAPDQGEVVRVVDGDTIVVRMAAGEERVRLIGVDTPESVDPRRPVECFGKEAARRTGELVPPGTTVRLERDAEARDRYDRLLAYVYRADDDTFVNLALVEEGFAQPLTIPPNVAYAERFTAAAREAREGDRGLWGACPAEN